MSEFISTELIRCPECQSLYDPPEKWDGYICTDGTRFLSECEYCKCEHEVRVTYLFASEPIEKE